MPHVDRVDLCCRYTRLPAAPSPGFPDRVEVWRPVVRLGLKVGQKQIRTYALLDTGADFIYFGTKWADALGIDWQAAPQVPFSGVGTAENMGYAADVTLILLDDPLWLARPRRLLACYGHVRRPAPGSQRFLRALRGPVENGREGIPHPPEVSRSRRGPTGGSIGEELTLFFSRKLRMSLAGTGSARRSVPSGRAFETWPGGSVSVCDRPRGACRTARSSRRLTASVTRVAYSNASTICGFRFGRSSRRSCDIISLNTSSICQRPAYTRATCSTVSLSDRQESDTGDDAEGVEKKSGAEDRI